MAGVAAPSVMAKSKLKTTWLARKILFDFNFTFFVTFFSYANTYEDVNMDVTVRNMIHCKKFMLNENQN